MITDISQIIAIKKRFEEKIGKPRYVTRVSLLLRDYGYNLLVQTTDLKLAQKEIPNTFEELKVLFET